MEMNDRELRIREIMERCKQSEAKAKTLYECLDSECEEGQKHAIQVIKESLYDDWEPDCMDIMTSAYYDIKLLVGEIDRLTEAINKMELQLKWSEEKEEVLMGTYYYGVGRGKGVVDRYIIKAKKHGEQVVVNDKDYETLEQMVKHISKYGMW